MTTDGVGQTEICRCEIYVRIDGLLKILGGLVQFFVNRAMCDPVQVIVALKVGIQSLCVYWTGLSRKCRTKPMKKLSAALLLR